MTLSLSLSPYACSQPGRADLNAIIEMRHVQDLELSKEVDNNATVYMLVYIFIKTSTWNCYLNLLYVSMYRSV